MKKTPRWFLPVVLFVSLFDLILAAHWVSVGDALNSAIWGAITGWTLRLALAIYEMG